MLKIFFYYIKQHDSFHSEGTKIKKLDLLNDFSELDKKSQQYKDIKRFNWFSQDYLGVGKDKISSVVRQG